MPDTIDLDFVRNAILNQGLKLNQGFDHSGKPFDWILDLREVLHQAPYLQLIARLLWNAIRKYRPDYVGGMETSAAPLTFGIISHAFSEGYFVRGFTVRKTPKPYGLRNLIEGPPIERNSRVVLVDDLVSSGDSVVRAAQLVKDLGAHPAAVAVVVDFEREAAKRLRALHIPLEHLTSLSALGITSRRAVKSPTVRWTYGPLNLGSYTAPQASPSVADSLVVVGGDLGFIVGLDMQGGEVWRISTREHEKGVRSSAVVHDKVCYFTGYDGSIRCARILDGQLEWSSKLADWIGTTPALSIPQRLLFVTANYKDGTGACIAVDACSGDWVWETPLRDYCYVNPLLSADGSLLIGSNDGRLVALDSATGREKWSFTSGGPIKGWLTYTDDLCLFGCFDGYLYALGAGTGDFRWKRKLADYLLHRAIVHDSKIIVPGANHLFSINPRTSEIAWLTATRGRVVGVVKDENSGIFVGGSDTGELCGYNPADGAEVWRIKLGGAIRALPALARNLCFVPSYDGYLYAIDCDLARMPA